MECICGALAAGSYGRRENGGVTLGKKVRVTNCLYSRKGMPWLRFSSLVRSVMSVCSSAKPGGHRRRVVNAHTHTHTHTQKHRHTHTHTQAHTHAYTHTHTHTHTERGVGGKASASDSKQRL